MDWLANPLRASANIDLHLGAQSDQRADEVIGANVTDARHRRTNFVELA